MDCSPSSSSVHGILQARAIEWVAIPFSRGSCWPRDRTQVSCVGRWILFFFRKVDSLPSESAGKPLYTAICIHISSPSWPSLPPTAAHHTSLAHHRALSRALSDKAGFSPLPAGEFCLLISRRGSHNQLKGFYYPSVAFREMWQTMTLGMLQWKSLHGEPHEIIPCRQQGTNSCQSILFYQRIIWTMKRDEGLSYQKVSSCYHFKTA